MLAELASVAAPMLSRCQMCPMLPAVVTHPETDPYKQTVRLAGLNHREVQDVTRRGKVTFCGHSGRPRILSRAQVEELADFFNEIKLRPPCALLLPSQRTRLAMF